jgi:hypothetical protein
MIELIFFDFTILCGSMPELNSGNGKDSFSAEAE